MTRIEIPGKPVGKGRPRFTGSGRTYTPSKTVAYENLVQFAWMQSGEETMDGNIRVNILAVFPIPASISKKKAMALMGQPYPHKPDADNLVKAILDGLNGLAYKDDAQVTQVSVMKRYGTESKAVVTIDQDETREDEYDVETGSI